MYVKAFMDGKEEIESLEERITGRFSCETISDAEGNVLVKANHMITPRRAALVMSKGVNSKGEPLNRVKIRTVLTCRSHNGICAKCYGANMATGQAVQVGGFQNIMRIHTSFCQLVAGLQYGAVHNLDPGAIRDQIRLTLSRLLVGDDNLRPGRPYR